MSITMKFNDSSIPLFVFMMARLRGWIFIQLHPVRMIMMLASLALVCRATVREFY